MAWAKGQSGNPKGPKAGKPFADALRMEIAAAGEDHKRLRTIAGVLLSKAEAGDIQAIKELADRVDGKVPQAVIGGDSDDPPIMHRVERVIVRPNNQDRDG